MEGAVTGRLDGAFNNAGDVSASGPLPGIDGAAWQAELSRPGPALVARLIPGSGPVPARPWPAWGRPPGEPGAS
jgi:hypothetical protein